MNFQHRHVAEEKASIPQEVIDLTQQRLGAGDLGRQIEEKAREEQTSGLVQPDRREKEELSRLLNDYTLLAPIENLVNTHSLTGEFVKINLVAAPKEVHGARSYVLLLRASDRKDQGIDLTTLGLVFRSEHNIEIEPLKGKSGLLFCLKPGEGYSVSCRPTEAAE